MIHVDIRYQKTDGWLWNESYENPLLKKPGSAQAHMNTQSFLIYSLIDGTLTLGEIADKLKQIYPDMSHQIELDLVKSVQDQLDLGLIVLAEDASLPAQYYDKELDHELCIMFLYHKTDAVTIQNYNLLTWTNPKAVIAPIFVNAESTLPGLLESIDVSQFDSPWDMSDVWRSVDGVIYTWFRNRKLNAKRYVLMEFDCLCTQPLQEAYAAVWNADLAAKDYYVPERHDWSWFFESHLLDESDRCHMAGLTPMAGMLFSHEALEKLSEAELTNPVFSEFRIGTTATRVGLKPQRFDFSLKSTVFHHNHDHDFSKVGVFHPVKEVVNPQLAPPPMKSLSLDALSSDSLTKTVLVIPSGRERYLRILMYYVDQLQQCGLIDELHLWLNTDFESDVAYIKQLATDRSWARVIESDKPKVGMGVARFLEYCTEPDTVYVRIDDDIVFVDVDHFAQFLQFRKQNHQYFMVYANTINNSLCSHLHQRFGAIDESLGIVEYDCFDRLSWSSGEFAEYAHSAFLQHFQNDTLDQFRFDSWQMGYKERLSTHVISWLGAEFAEIPDFDQVEDDEFWLSCVHPGRIHKPNIIYGKMLACHFAYYPQREVVDRCDILLEYEKLAGM